jgi:hypothetical protein
MRSRIRETIGGSSANPRLNPNDGGCSGISVAGDRPTEFIDDRRAGAERARTAPLAPVPNARRRKGNSLVGLRRRRRTLPVSLLLVWRQLRRPPPRAHSGSDGCRRREMGDGAHPPGPHPLVRPPHLLGRHRPEPGRIRRDLDTRPTGAPSRSRPTARCRPGAAERLNEALVGKAADNKCCGLTGSEPTPQLWRGMWDIRPTLGFWLGGNPYGGCGGRPCTAWALSPARTCGTAPARFDPGPHDIGAWLRRRGEASKAETLGHHRPDGRCRRRRPGRSPPR